MIFDRLENIRRYEKIDERVYAGLCAAASLAPDTAEGSYPDDNPGVRLIVSTYQTVPYGNKHYELHREYADIQVVLSGTEVLYYAGSATEESFDTSADFGIAANVSDEIPVCLREGYFCVLFPGEAHKPGCDGECTGSSVRKAVVKLKMS